MTPGKPPLYACGRTPAAHIPLRVRRGFYIVPFANFFTNYPPTPLVRAVPSRYTVSKKTI